MKKKDSGFTVIPNEPSAIYDLSEEFNYVHVYILERVRSFERSGYPCYMSNKQFSEVLRVSERTIRRAIKSLIDHKVLWAGYHQEAVNNKQRILRIFNQDIEDYRRQQATDGQIVQDTPDTVSTTDGHCDQGEMDTVSASDGHCDPLVENNIHERVQYKKEQNPENRSARSKTGDATPCGVTYSETDSDRDTDKDISNIDIFTLSETNKEEVPFTYAHSPGNIIDKIFSLIESGELEDTSKR